MRKKIIYFLCVLMVPICFMLTGCSNNNSKGQNPSDQVKFIDVGTYKKGDRYYTITVNKATKVMYLFESTGGEMTIMLNEDGTPMIYQGELK